MTMNRRVRTVTICGTFNLALPEVARAVDLFHSRGLVVLSPADPAFVERLGGFVFVASDRHRDPLLVERRHLQAVAEADLIWLVAPDGYVGLSGTAEVSFAAGRGVPVFTADDVREPAVAALVMRVSSADEALNLPTGKHRGEVSLPPTLIVDPLEGAMAAHANIDLIAGSLRDRERVLDRTLVTHAAGEVRRSMSGL